MYTASYPLSLTQEYRSKNTSLFFLNYQFVIGLSLITPTNIYTWCYFSHLSNKFFFGLTSPPAATFILYSFLQQKLVTVSSLKHFTHLISSVGCTKTLLITTSQAPLLTLSSSQPLNLGISQDSVLDLFVFPAYSFCAYALPVS